MNGAAASVSASSVLRARLTGADHRLVAAVVFPGAAHLADPTSGHIEVAIVTHQAVAHPHAAVLAPRAGDRLLRRLRPGAEVQIGHRRIRLPDGDVEVARWWSPRPTLPTVDHARLHATHDAVRNLVAAQAPDLPDLEAARLRTFTDALAGSDHAVATSASRRLLGLGAGSTPTGDDLLAGALSAIALFGAAIDDLALPPSVRLARTVGRELVTRSETATTALSAALLRHAVRGEVCRPAGRLLLTMARRAHRRTLSEALGGLLAVGTSSGRDLAVGILAGVDVLLRSTHHDPHPVRDLTAASPPPTDTGRI